MPNYVKGHIRVATDKKQQPITGRDLHVYLVDDFGNQHHIPAHSIVVGCEGRDKPVMATIKVRVQELDVDLMATFVREDIDLEP